MTDGSDSVTMIGLHRLEPADGRDSLRETSALVSRREAALRSPGVIAFPQEATRPPGDVPAAAFGRDAATGRNVVAFATAAAKYPGHSRKA